jgi:hypothetical protein
MRHVRIPLFVGFPFFFFFPHSNAESRQRFPVNVPNQELKEGHSRVKQWKMFGRAPVPETDFFNQWEIPLEAYLQGHWSGAALHPSS